MSDARRILIADDEPAVRATLAEFFATTYRDCVIEAVADGAAAVRVLVSAHARPLRVSAPHRRIHS